MSAAQPAEKPTGPQRDSLLLIGIGVALAAWCAAVGSGGYYVQREVLLCQISGYAALGYLAASLLGGPMWRVLSWRGISVSREFAARFSRNAGIAAALAASAHTVIALTTYLKYDWYVVLRIAYLQWGGLALGVLLVLLLASYKPLMKTLRWQLWKPLFRLSFAAAVLSLPHVLYAPFAWRWLVLVLFGGAVLMSLLRWLPERKIA